MKPAPLVTFLIVASAVSVAAQKKPPVITSSLCTRDYAVDTTRQQILQTRTFDNAVSRIAVLLRAADLLWPHDQEKAMATFMEAFDLAAQNYKEIGDQTKRVSETQFAARYTLPDQRFKVISALAKRDPAEARKLSEKMLQDEAKEASEKPAAADDQLNRKSAEKLLTVANGLLETDLTSAVMFARNSLRYPAVMQLPAFLYAVSKTNKQAADQFYVEALGAYGRAPMDQFLYLSSYPFGNNREAGEMPGYTIYRVPDGFAPNPALQRQFVQALLARVESAISEPIESVPNYRYSGHAQMWLALSRLEKQVQANLPDLFDSAVNSKEKLFALLNPPVQKRISGLIDYGNAPKKSFDERVEAAEKLTNVDERDRDLTMAVTGNAKDVSVDRVLSVIDKISDSNVRGPLTNWFYYFGAQALIADKNLIEARKMASKVNELDQRAYLFSRIAEESLKESADQTAAREMLNEIGDAISKAPKTLTSARALLALAYLYSKIDTNRGVEELGNAVRTINVLENPDFTLQFTMMKIEGKSFGSYASYSTPGFNPENAFREMGKVDFDGTLLQAATFSDKSLRALTTLSVIEPCLTLAPKRPPRKAK